MATDAGNNRSGAPRKVIDWVRVDKLLRQGCNGKGAAAELGIHYDTLVNRAFSDGIVGEDTPYPNFSDYLSAKRARLANLILMTQTKVALGEVDEDGKIVTHPDKGMLIWLGKQICDQSDRRTNIHEGELGVGTINIMSSANSGEDDDPEEEEEEYYEEE